MLRCTKFSCTLALRCTKSSCTLEGLGVRNFSLGVRNLPHKLLRVFMHSQFSCPRPKVRAARTFRGDEATKTCSCTACRKKQRLSLRRRNTPRRSASSSAPASSKRRAGNSNTQSTSGPTLHAHSDPTETSRARRSRRPRRRTPETGIDRLRTRRCAKSGRRA